MKKLLLLLMSFSLLAWGGCSEDDAPNVITIEISEPMDNAEIKLSDASDVHVHVEITATDEIHDLELVLYAENDPTNYIIEIDEHVHQATVTKMSDVDLSSFAVGTVFHLEVKVCADHDCAEITEKEISFTLVP